jgi:hypothetical protein
MQRIERRFFMIRERLFFNCTTIAQSTPSSHRREGREG